jgi:hypothetical protein
MTVWVNNTVKSEKGHYSSYISYRNEENRTNRVVLLILVINSSDHFQTSHGSDKIEKVSRGIYQLLHSHNPHTNYHIFKFLILIY